MISNAIVFFGLDGLQMERESRQTKGAGFGEYWPLLSDFIPFLNK